MVCATAKLRSMCFSPRFCSCRSHRSILRFCARSKALMLPPFGSSSRRCSMLYTAAPGAAEKPAAWRRFRNGAGSTRSFPPATGRGFCRRSTIFRRRYASLSLRAASPAAASISEADRFIADTERTLRDIGSLLLTAAAGRAGGEYFMEQYERLQKSC